jgi:hypothetical protein
VRMGETAPQESARDRREPATDTGLRPGLALSQ